MKISFLTLDSPNISRVTRAPIIKILMFIKITRQDLATKKDFTKKY